MPLGQNPASSSLQLKLKIYKQDLEISVFLLKKTTTISLNMLVDRFKKIENGQLFNSEKFREPCCLWSCNIENNRVRTGFKCQLKCPGGVDGAVMTIHDHDCS